MSKASPEQIRGWAQQFKNHGFVSNIPLLNVEEQHLVQQTVNGLEKDVRKLPPQWVNVALENRILWDTCVNNSLLIDLASEIFQTQDIAHFSTTLFTKYGQNTDPGVYVGWHQDLYYWGLNPQEVFTAWIAVDDVTAEKGCLHVIPGEYHHTHELLTHDIVKNTSNVLMAYQDINPKRFGGVEKALPLPLRAGEASLHDGFTVHGSPPNRTNSRRCGFTVQIIPGYVDLEEYAYANLEGNSETVLNEDWRKPIMLRGRDVLGPKRRGVPVMIRDSSKL